MSERWEIDSPHKLIMAVHFTASAAVAEIEAHLCAFEHYSSCPHPGMHRDRAEEMLSVWLSEKGRPPGRTGT